MKNSIFAVILLLAFSACKNQEINFPDYDYTAGYFPYQYPVRTLVLGNYIYDNTNDNNHKFLISVTMGGVYENKKDRIFKIQVDESLCNNVVFASTNTPIYPLPRQYYTLSSEDQIVIPAGEISGSIEVQLTDAFFDDPLASKLAYVVPVKITEVVELDSLLTGVPRIPNADPRVAADWEVAPKNFTLFAVKFVNPFHGNYFQRGRSSVKDSTGQTIESNVYRERYVEQNPVVSLLSVSKNQVVTSATLRSPSLEGSFDMVMTFNGNDCVISSPEGANYQVSGSGKFIENADEWGNKKRDALHISYDVSLGNQVYSATDTLVVRDRNVIMETFQPRIVID